MPNDREKTWDERILEAIPSGVDETIVAENLALTPTERLQKMLSVLAFVEEVRRVNREKLPRSR
jgi:hypothetical protein